MHTKNRYALILALVLLAGAALVAVTRAAPGNAPLAQGGAPAVVAYQGEVRVSDTPYDGDGYFKFAVVNSAGSTSYWSNDGTSTTGNEPTAAVQLTVSDGLFSVMLGDTSLGGMTQALAATVFSQPDRYLRVWFSSDNVTFTPLTPDTRITAAPYALQAQEAANADTVDGLHASELGTHYQNVVIVAGSGGDYTSVQAAIDSISAAAADNAYLVWVAPGVYSETVTMKPHVHLQGAGQGVTIITSTASSSVWPPEATLVLTSDISLRDLTVGNGSPGGYNAALRASAGATRTLAANVTAWARGSGASNFAIMLSGSGTGVTLQQVTALAENGSSRNYGLVNSDSAAAVLLGGSFTARGGEYAFGIINASSAMLEAENIVALGEDSITHTYGLDNIGGSAAVLRGGSFTAHGGGKANWGINNSEPGTTLDAEGITVLGESDSSIGYIIGLDNHGGATATLRGGSFTARGGEDAKGIHNASAMLEAEGVTALAEDGSGTNHGLDNDDSTTAIVRGGSFTARGGDLASGVRNAASATLETESIAALGEDGNNLNVGLLNYSGGNATLHAGTFTARGGNRAWAIFTRGSTSTLEAESVTTLATEAITHNSGVYIYAGAVAVLRGGNFTGRGGAQAGGVQNQLFSTLTAEGITALAENGADNYGLGNYNNTTATVRSAVVTARGGVNNYALCNELTATMAADNVTTLAENGSGDNHGMWNVDNATVVLHGSSFTAQGGDSAYGIYNSGLLNAEGVSVLAEDGGATNYGLQNTNGATATLRSGSITARGGMAVYGIFTHGDTTTLDAAGVTVLAENGSEFNFGIENYDYALATLRNCSFIGRGGNGAVGVQNTFTSTLSLENITALGEGGSSANYGLVHGSGTTTADSSQFTGSIGLHLDSGTVYLGVSQLDGGATNAGGTLVCYGVYDETYFTYSCP